MDGKEYPGKTIYEMLNSIQTYSRIECNRNLALIDKTSRVFRNLKQSECRKHKLKYLVKTTEI